MQDQLIQTLRAALADSPMWQNARIAPVTHAQSMDTHTVALIHLGNSRHVYVSLLPELAPRNAVVEALKAHSRCLSRRGAWAQEMVVVPRLQVSQPIVPTHRVGVTNLNTDVQLECLGILAQA
ncbi:MAG TPA: hypothetical protein VGM81_07530 [Burkholderiaceae bacterium]